MADPEELKYQVKVTRQDGEVRTRDCDCRADAADFVVGLVLITQETNDAMTVDDANTSIIQESERMQIVLNKHGQFFCKIEAYPVEG